MTDRKSLDDMTSDDLDQLYDALDRAETENAELRDALAHCHEREPRQRAETALRRARELHRETCPFAAGSVPPTAFTCSMCDALAEPKDQT